MNSTETLEQENSRLKEELQKRENELLSKNEVIDHLNEMVEFLRRTHYAPKSEQVSSKQLGIFDESEEIEAVEGNEAEETEVTSHKRKPPRKRISDELPREERVIDLAEEEKTCSHDGTELKYIGDETSEEIEYIPAQTKVIKTIRKKYSCPCCEEGVKTPEAPKKLIPRSMATASLLAAIATSKFVDYLPLYRLEKIFARIGFIVTRATMAKWMIRASEELLPLYNLLQDKLLERDYVQMDETTVQVLNEEGKKSTSRSYMWVRHAPGKNPIVLYDYAPTRSGQVPLELLEGFSGYLQVDGYDGYSAVCENSGVTRVGCMDHCRRKFREAFKSSKGKGLGKKVLVILKKLYKIEERIKDSSIKERYEVRQAQSKPLMEEFKTLLQENKDKYAPKSMAGKAIQYALNEWIYLERYLEDGKLNISNIWVENKIRPFCLGRKNWLFSATTDGANSSAILYGLIETAKANNIQPFDYLKEVFEKLPHAETVEDYERLLPLKSHQS